MNPLFAIKRAKATGKPVRMPPEKNGAVQIIWPDRPTNNAANADVADKMLEGLDYITWGKGT